MNYLHITLMIILIILFTSANAQYMNENTIVSGSMEYYMATDDTTYTQGENVQMLYRITNLGQNPQMFYYYSSQEYDFFVETMDFETIWIWSYGYCFFDVMWERTILPGNSIERYREWDMTDNNNFSVAPGTYRVIGTSVNYMPEPVPVPVYIEIIHSVLAEDNICESMEYKLYQNYPNPFHQTTTISYYIPMDNKVNLSIFNIKGQKVKTLVNEEKEKGEWKKTWNGTDEHNIKVPSGIYFYKIETDGFYEIKKTILLR